MINRRDFIRYSSIGMTASLSGCLPGIDGLFTKNKNLKNIVFLTMNGGLSQMESFDYKPELIKSDGKSIYLPESENPYSSIIKPRTSFKQYGDSGAWISSAFPELSTIADKLTFIKSCKTFSLSHFPASRYLFTGSAVPDQPSILSWLGHLLSPKPKDLPASISMYDSNRPFPPFSDGMMKNIFLPDSAKGYLLKHSVIEMLKSSEITDPYELKSIRLINQLNKKGPLRSHNESIERAAAFDRYSSFKNSIQSTVDFEKEPEYIKKQYGLNDPSSSSMAKRLITARNLLESGVKVININSGGFGMFGWDAHHSFDSFFDIAKEVDRPITGFINDLEQRGLLDSTLVVFWTEFGRLPSVESLDPSDNKKGRDHNPNAFTIWLAGGGISPGKSIGTTDELAYKAVEDVYSIHDIHHTIFKLVGIDLNDLNYWHEGKLKTYFKQRTRMIKGLI
ncbi:MAG: hypothetical protein CL678_02350 [Bdellovibrionaceae bacterium]|nr:hypothetical protein [Halobacteriovorax sp.]MBN20101.1 hypothetical protein [Pseudobdellovibrionaceae bacterium]|tara:strand:- start:46476 stop:47825 length:1350 start_codon:yes stop_codon:yes gene_type:complete